MLNFINKDKYTDYDEENDIMTIRWSKEKTEFSMEFFEGRMIVDFDDHGEIVALEIFDFKREVKAFDKRLDYLLDEKEEEWPQEKNATSVESK